MLSVVNSPRSTPHALLAPGASTSYVPARAPGRGESLPGLDERLIAPEANAQVLDGVVIETMGANPPHATRHAAVSHVFVGCLAADYEAAVDMLTRVDRKNDLAADVSIFPVARDRKGGRKLEEITFEICDSESEGHVTRKARKFAKRGVRRVFYVRVDTRAVFEWRRDDDQWVRFADDGEIRDRCFVVPLPVKALVDRVLADDAVARALVARRHPVVEAVRAEGREAGHRDGLREGLREGLEPLLHQFARRLGRPLDEAEQRRLRERLATLGGQRLGDVVLDLSVAELAAWVADDSAR